MKDHFPVSYSHPLLYFVVFLVSLLILGVIIVSKPQPQSEPIYASVWHSSRNLEPTQARPIVAVWLRENQPEIYFARRVGNCYFEYIPNPSLPTHKLSDYAPAFWSEMPGAR